MNENIMKGENSMITLGNLCKEATEEYIKHHKIKKPNPVKITSDLLDVYYDKIKDANDRNPEKAKLPILKELPPSEIARLIVAFYKVARVTWVKGNSEKSKLMVYNESGENEGIYTASNSEFGKLISAFNPMISEKDLAETISKIEREAPLVDACDNENYTAVNNGIFDSSTKQLIPFSPEIVFTAKSRVNYNPQAKNVVLHNKDDGSDWDVESWIDDMFDDESMSNLIWQILSAVMHPYRKYDECICFYSETGNNGKGSLCELMRNLCGEGSHCTIPFNHMNDRFLPDALLHSTAIITDENQVDSRSLKSETFKALCTQDKFNFEMKFRGSFEFCFHGRIIQCINNLIKFDDTTDSLYRRFLIVPFTKSFTGAERKYIKDDYLHRPEVLEFVMYKALNMDDFKDYDIPTQCADLMHFYKSYNDPIRAFYDEFMDEFVWDLLPYKFLYDLYKKWYAENCQGQPVAQGDFKKSTMNIFVNCDEWKWTKPYPTGNLISVPEPLIAKYDLTRWMRDNYRGEDIIKCLPTTKSSYEGLLRIKS